MVVTEVDDWTWWTSIGGDLADQVPDEIWDAALETALDPSTQAITDELIPDEDTLIDAAELAYADDSWGDDDVAGVFHGDSPVEDVDSNLDGGEHHGDDGYVGL